MKFDRAALNGSVISLLRSSVPADRCIGRNFLIEENVSERRRLEMEALLPESNDVIMVSKEYFFKTVQGRTRDHYPSTFKAETNHLAIIPMTAIDPAIKFLRLERVDRLLGKAGQDIDEIKSAIETRDWKLLSKLVRLFLRYRGARPFFAIFKSDFEREFGENDWLQSFIDGVGLFHHYPYDPIEPAMFVLMEYSAGEVVQQARAKAIEDCFAVPTVLESGNNPAFCPTPRATGHGYAVDFRERDIVGSGIREILHPRFEYSWKHVKKLEIWTGAATPDVEMARERRLEFLRMVSGRAEYGVIGA